MCLLGCATGAPVGGGTITEGGGICPNAAARVKTSAANAPRMKLYVILEILGWEAFPVEKETDVVDVRQHRSRDIQRGLPRAFLGGIIGPGDNKATRGEVRRPSRAYLDDVWWWIIRILPPR